MNIFWRKMAFYEEMKDSFIDSLKPFCKGLQYKNGHWENLSSFL